MLKYGNIADIKFPTEPIPPNENLVSIKENTAETVEQIKMLNVRLEKAEQEI